MEYIKITNPLFVRDRDGEGHLHSVIGKMPGGGFVEQSAQHHQIVQRCFLPDGKVVLTYFSEEKGVMARMGEQTYNLNLLLA